MKGGDYKKEKVYFYFIDYSKASTCKSCQGVEDV